MNWPPHSCATYDIVEQSHGQQWLDEASLVFPNSTFHLSSPPSVSSRKKKVHQCQRLN
jgi:hypothetical protein